MVCTFEVIPFLGVLVLAQSVEDGIVFVRIHLSNDMLGRINIMVVDFSIYTFNFLAEDFEEIPYHLVGVPLVIELRLNATQENDFPRKLLGRLYVFTLHVRNLAVDLLGAEELGVLLYFVEQVSVGNGVGLAVVELGEVVVFCVGDFVHEAAADFFEVDHVLLERLIAVDEILVDYTQLGNEGDLQILDDVLDLLLQVVEVPQHALLLPLDLLLEVLQVVFLLTQQEQHLLAVQLLLGQHPIVGGTCILVLL